MDHRLESFAAPSFSAEAGTATDPEAAVRRRRAAVAMAAVALLAALTLSHLLLKTTLDLPLETALNRPARLYPGLDYALRVLDRFPVFQGVALMALLCGALVDARRRADVLYLTVGVVSASLAAVLSRVLQHFLPASPRPLYDPALQFIPPFGANIGALRDHTSYPSDHAALLCGLACALYLVRPRLGLFTLAWVAVLGLIRMYGGYHYLTDTLGGWLLGAAVVFAGAALPLQRLDPILAWTWRHRFWAAAILFFAAVEAADMFDDVRGAAKFVLHAIRGVPDLWV